jgi:Peptidase M15
VCSGQTNGLIIRAGARTDFNLAPNFRTMQLLTARLRAVSTSIIGRLIPSFLSDSPDCARRFLNHCNSITVKITVNSGYRCHKLHRAVGSKTDKSNHLFGYAADVEIPGVNNQTFAQ